MTIARDYSCDGCFEPMFTGKSEFKFAYIFLLKVVCLFSQRLHGWLEEGTRN